MTGSSGNGMSRRKVLEGIGALAGVGVVSWYHEDNNYTDTDEDGIPDELESSESYHNYLKSIYGAQFNGLDPDRKDLIIDARYIGDASISKETKEYTERLFRENGIHAQWLDHPAEYPEDWFKEEYDRSVIEALWPTNSFYEEQVEDELKNTSIQLIVLPANEGSERKIQNGWEVINSENGGSAGVSFGNRAMMVEKDSFNNEATLALHEIGHTWLCHDYNNPDNVGLMGYENLIGYISTNPEAVIDYMPWEWETIHDNLENIRDTTGADVIGRKCLVEEEAKNILQ